MTRARVAVVLCTTAVLATGAVACSSGTGGSGGAGASRSSPVPSGAGPSGSGAGGSGTAPAAPAAVTGSITVFAAASLTATFTALGAAFERANPGAHVTFSFGASSTLATQITQGAPADVFASAATANMTTVVQAGAASDPVDFASNSAEVAVPPSNPAGITALADLARPGVKVAVCQPKVPCGVLATTVFGRAGLHVTPVTQEADVSATLAKVEQGEVDAAVVYVTDVRGAAGKVTGVPVPAGQNATTEYPLAVTHGSGDRATATAFTAYVLSAAGRSVLTAAGFAAP